MQYSDILLAKKSC